MVHIKLKCPIKVFLIYPKISLRAQGKDSRIRLCSEPYLNNKTSTMDSQMLEFSTERDVWDKMRTEMMVYREGRRRRRGGLEDNEVGRHFC